MLHASHVDLIGSGSSVVVFFLFISLSDFQLSSRRFFFKLSWKSADWRQGRVRRLLLAPQTGKLVLQWGACAHGKAGCT